TAFCTPVYTPEIYYKRIYDIMQKNIPDSSTVKKLLFLNISVDFLLKIYYNYINDCMKILWKR
ncbi:MAG: hypothetical protein J6A16_01985, partial [Oscillospiraceae bacterium]|nr:hypothetical protein [Oscillospiraceae bacterium]